MKNTAENTPIKLLWTGGLDSTYRLLELVFEKKLPVQTIYVKDPTRPSTKMELSTMEKIIKMVEMKNSDGAALILPTLFFELDEIPKNEEISQTFKELQKIRHIGHQYDWLARFCKWQGFNDLELGVIKKGEVSSYGESLSQSFAPFLEEDENGVSALNESKVNSAIDKAKARLYFELFKYYRFPIIKHSKQEMLALARAKGWQGIIENTWFCHRPKKGKPCGKCNPCRTAVSEGLGYTIPFSSRLIFNLKSRLGIYRLKKHLRNA